MAFKIDLQDFLLVVVVFCFFALGNKLKHEGLWGPDQNIFFRFKTYILDQTK